MYFHIFQLIHHELDTKTYRSIEMITRLSFLSHLKLKFRLKTADKFVFFTSGMKYSFFSVFSHRLNLLALNY